MRVRNGLSRRHVLQTAGAVGGLVLAGRAFAQAPARKIEQLAPELDKIIATSEPIQELASGFGGDLWQAPGIHFRVAMVACSANVCNAGHMSQ